LKKSLVLTGMMGVGKSTLGKVLSLKLNSKFIDVDKLIEKREKMSIQNIFKAKDEKYFREIEEKITLEVLDTFPAVIALGGGAFINRNIRDKVLKRSISFWLDSNINTLLKRMSNKKKRPLIDKESPKAELIKLYAKRKDAYKMADHKIDCSKYTKNEIIKQILKVYEKS
jgi:shikimate kinase